jgi:hypothetical protein
MPEESGPRRSLPGGAAICILVASFGAIALTFARMRGGVPQTQAVYAANRPSTAAPAPAEQAAVGSITRLQPHSGQPIWIAANAEAWAALRKALALRDSAQLHSLVQAGWAFTVDDDTQAQIVGQSPGYYRVRVLEGDAQGKIGWVPVQNAEGLPMRRGF